jgi:hypothetical protein
MFVWTPIGVAGLVAAIVAWSAAVFILRTTPDATVRRRLALLLFAEGLMIVTSGAGPLQWIGDAAWYHRVLVLHAVADGLIVAVYLPTLAAVLDTRWVRFFGSSPGMWIPVTLGSGCAIGSMLRPDLAWGPIVPSPPALEFAGRFALGSVGPVESAAFAMLMGSYFYGLFATVVSWRQAETPLLRRRNGRLALAFGTRDIFWGWLFFVAVGSTAMYGATVPVEYLKLGIWNLQLAACGLVLYLLLLAYGIATEHLFDIDLKVKWTLERGTVATTYVAVFFVVSEGAENFLSDRLGTVLGLAATGLLLFALAPIQRAAERLSDTAMPHVHDTPEFRKFRKLEIYGEAFAASRRDGGTSAVQRVALDRLRKELELSAADASHLEAELAPG